MFERQDETLRASTKQIPNWPTLPGYETLAELGRGGMGVVYKARHLSSRRLVALKLIRDAALASPQDRARFRIEIEAAARMRHPNIVEIYDAGEHEGRPYLIMELVEGIRLDELRGQPLPPGQAAVLVRTLAQAIQHAHMQSIVHRDLKPANILLAYEGHQSGDGKPDAIKDQVLKAIPKVTDFGLAKRLDSESTAYTQEGMILGTASYMAPEQAAGRIDKIGPAVDVYALGAILYELLTGQPPFQTDSWNKTVQQVLFDEPVSPRRLQPEIPRDLETICLKCLEKEIDARYSSATEFAEDLKRYLEGVPVAAVPLDHRKRLERLAARDGYQILDTIGHGPRSTIFRALSGPSQQSVALKVFATGICTSDEWDSRLQRSRDMWAAIVHPHIIAVQRTGWWEDAPFLITEYVPNGSLAARLGGNPYPVPDALRLVEQLAEIVSYLHRQGVVHGNLKPSNIMLAADDIPRLIDFHLTGGLFLSLRLANDEESIGQEYLAPELFENPFAELRPYTDIYGLGVILYELLTGRPPFAGAGPRAMRQRVQSDDPVPPSRINSRVTTPIEECCLRCLRKNPWRRYHRAYDVMRRLRYLYDNPAGQVVPNGQWPK